MRPVQIGLLVTGRGEAIFAPVLLRALGCGFTVIYRFDQLPPIPSRTKLLKMVGTGQLLEDKEGKIGLMAAAYLRTEGRFAILIDDLEHDRRPQAETLFARYRTALHSNLGDSWKFRASVHFFVNMIEAYYFADASAINDALGLQLEDHAGDVEEIRHPKNDLKRLKKDFKEIDDAREIVRRLDLGRVLADPDTCASLRTLAKWCCRASGRTPDGRFQLARGRLNPLTAGQIDALPEPAT